MKNLCFHWEAPERREIVDYVSSKGLNLDRIFSKRDITGDAGPESAKMAVLPSEEEGGWGGRINRYLISYLSSLASDENAIKILTGFKGIGKKTAENLVEVFQDEARVASLRKGKMDALGGIKKEILETIVKQGVFQMAACVDEPVYCGYQAPDTSSRESLHGKSGMKVTALSIQET